MARARKLDIQIEDEVLKNLLYTFALNMEMVRKYRGMTQQELAFKSKLSISTVAAIEQKCLQNLNFSTLTAISKALKVTPINLLSKKISLKSLKN
ncbi:MAG: helix-turn-helix transcriptional regulator [Bdellovibrionales bacterium]|nr:helix-turn-helix transcriptional regulator [Bdellovibrionales bacterium]